MFLFTGLNVPEVAITLLRVAMGTFFLISGYHKLFNRQRHATITQTMVADHVPDVSFNSWFVPSAEFAGGFALFIGLLTPIAAAGLFIICCGATIMDGLKRIAGWSPIDKGDYLDDVLYLPEVQYAIILVALVFTGGGPFSLDNAFIIIFQLH